MPRFLALCLLAVSALGLLVGAQPAERTAAPYLGTALYSQAPVRFPIEVTYPGPPDYPDEVLRLSWTFDAWTYWGVQHEYDAHVYVSGWNTTEFRVFDSQGAQEPIHADYGYELDHQPFWALIPPYESWSGVAQGEPVETNGGTVCEFDIDPAGEQSVVVRPQIWSHWEPGPVTLWVEVWLHPPAISHAHDWYDYDDDGDVLPVEPWSMPAWIGVKAAWLDAQ